VHLIPGFLHVLANGADELRIVFQPETGQDWQVLAKLTEQGSIAVEATHADEIGDDESVMLASDRDLEEFFSQWDGAAVGRSTWQGRVLGIESMNQRSREQFARVAARTPTRTPEATQSVVAASAL
jgi:hypothetical protein